MPFDSEKRSKEAQKRPRDKKGHFLTLKPKVKISGQANLLEKLIDTKGNPDSDSMLAIYFRNPLKKITEILEEIKNKQSTKVNLSFTIPLVALPIVILLAFQFGRYQSSCTDHFSSQIGTLQNITVTKSVTPDNWFFKFLSSLPFLSDIYTKTETKTQPILVKDDSSGIMIENQGNVDLDPFTQSKVIVFGNYNSCSQTLLLDSDKNISNY